MKYSVGTNKKIIMNWNNYEVPEGPFIEDLGNTPRASARFSDAMKVARRTMDDMGLTCCDMDYVLGVNPENGSPMAAYANFKLTMFEVVLVVRQPCLRVIESIEHGRFIDHYVDELGPRAGYLK